LWQTKTKIAQYQSQKNNSTFGRTYNAFYNHINTLKIFVAQKMDDGRRL